MNRKLLPDKIKLALAYYFHTRHQSEILDAKEALQKLNWFINGNRTYTGHVFKIEWNKETEWAKVAVIARKLGFVIESTGGTFFFSKKRGNVIYDWMVDDNSFFTQEYSIRGKK